MPRRSGSCRTTMVGGEKINAFIPFPLPPEHPPLLIEGRLLALLTEAQAAISRLAIAGAMVPSPHWFLYGFVRKEAVLSSQIEGTQATLMDLLTFQATQKTARPAEVEEICNYVDALALGQTEIRRPNGLPIGTRLLCVLHKRLMRGTRGAGMQPGCIRTSQNWIGGSRPGNARFVPPPADAVPEALAQLERWIHAEDLLPPLIRAGMAHVQFETIHPFLDGNGRMGRLLVALLFKHWGILDPPLIYLSLAFKRHRQDYYHRLMEVRTKGDWEGWSEFFLQCIRESAEDGIGAAQRLFTLISADRGMVSNHKAATVTAIRLFDLLPEHPIVTLQRVMKILQTTKPTGAKAIDSLRRAGVLQEMTGKQRDRVYAYGRYLKVLTEDTGETDQE